jgi:hypothetical protein
MPDKFLNLSDAERREALGVTVSNSGRPGHLLEKDVWVVWCLRALFESPLGEHLVFKGGTSLSKVYGAIRRFSEDVDLTYDIRALAPDLVDTSEDNPIPPTRSQSRRWSREVRERLPIWVKEKALPTIEARLATDKLSAKVAVERDKLLVTYVPLETGSGYVSPTVTLEFGARSTGEPSEVHNVVCDAAEQPPGRTAVIAYSSVSGRSSEECLTLWNVDAQSDRRKRDGGALMDRQPSAGCFEVRRTSALWNGRCWRRSFAR